MSSFLKSFFFSLILIKAVYGDGYPFDPETQEFQGDALRVQLNAGQIEEISATGLVTFSSAQLELIHRLYPRAKARQRTITATFNDNRENLDDAPEVECFWLRADQVAISIDPKIMADRAVLEKIFTEVIEKPNPGPEVLRLSPGGKIYHLGKPIDLPEAFRLIAAIERPERPGDYFGFKVVVPPPYRPDVIGENGKSCNTVIRELFAALEAHGKSCGVPVFKSW